MVQSIIRWSLAHRWVILLLMVALVVGGGYCAEQIDIEAYPDPTPPIVEVTAQNPALSATEMERLVTVPLEKALSGIRGEQTLRSISMPGLTNLTLQFTYASDYWDCRQQVLNRFADAQLPTGVNPSIDPDTPGSEMTYRFVVRGQGYNLNDCKTAADWVLDREYRQVLGVADLSSFGGTVKEYQVTVAPDALKRFGLTLSQVQNAIANANGNVGGNKVRLGSEEFDVRGIGLLGGGTDPTLDLPASPAKAIQQIRQRELAKVQDIENVLITNVGGVPITVGRVGRVTISHQPRLGRVGLDEDDDLVQALIFPYRGVHSRPLLAQVRAKTEEINHSGILPPGMAIEPYYDKTKFINITTKTVADNLAIGMGLVALVLVFFLGDLWGMAIALATLPVALWLAVHESYLAAGAVGLTGVVLLFFFGRARSALIVALMVPLALLFAVSGLYCQGLSANLLSIGAVDFGIIVDSSVIIVESIYRHLSNGTLAGPLRSRILSASAEVQSALFFSTLIIVLAFIPLFTMQGPEGKIFAPMAETYAFAIAGGLLLAVTAAPVLCSFLLKKSRPQEDNFLVRRLKTNYLWTLHHALNHRFLTLLLIALAVALTALVVPQVGAEFMPELDEGNLWLRATFPQQTSLEDAARLVRDLRSAIHQVPEVTTVLSQLGRPDDGTDPTPTNNCEFFIDLKPPEQRDVGRDRRAIVQDLQERLHVYRGIDFGFSQPIRDNLFEILTGVKGEDSVKLYGTDLPAMEKKAGAIADVLRTVPGLEDVGVLSVLGRPELVLRIDKARCAKYGVQVGDVEAVIQGAIGVKAFTQMVEGEKTFDVILRLPQETRTDPTAIGNIPIEINNSVLATPVAAAPSTAGSAAPTLSPTGSAINATGNTYGGLGRVPLRDLLENGTVEVKTGPALIYREHYGRYLPVKFTVRGRDLAGAVAEAQQQVAARVTLTGFHLEWGGEYRQMLEANERLTFVIPASLLLIVMVLYWAFNSGLDALLVLTNVIDLSLGGIWALYLTHTPFSVSAAVGFISIFGVAVQDGILLVSYFKQLQSEGMPLGEAIVRGAELRLRPVMMTSLTAALGLLPAALSTRIGAQTQRPLAIVVVGGMVTTIFLTRYLVPVLYSFYGASRSFQPDLASQGIDPLPN